MATATVKPRNTLVLVKLIEQSERQVGKIVKATKNEHLTEAEVIAVGEGNIAAGGGRSDTYDLVPGQRVLVMYKDPDLRMGPGALKNVGLPVYQEDGTVFYLYEQGRIIGIVAEPGQFAAAPSPSIIQSVLN